MYAADADKFGWLPSRTADRAVQVFQAGAARTVVELGCGNGRDALHVVQRGFSVLALDYAAVALRRLDGRARALGVHRAIRTIEHDARRPLPFGDAAVDGVFAHMFLNMAFSDDELTGIFDEMHRVLRPGGSVVFSVRTLADPDACAGRALTAFIRDVEGDIIRFFSDRCVERFGHRFELIGQDAFEEGELPKRLVLVTLRKPLPRDS